MKFNMGELKGKVIVTQSMIQISLSFTSQNNVNTDYSHNQNYAIELLV